MVNWILELQTKVREYFTITEKAPAPLGLLFILKHHSYNEIVIACCVWFCLLHAAFTTAAAVSLVQNRFLLMNVYLK